VINNLKPSANYVYHLLQHLTTLRSAPYGQNTAFIALKNINVLVFVDVEFFSVT
jgi:hypothetical protein